MEKRLLLTTLLCTVSANWDAYAYDTPSSRMNETQKNEIVAEEGCPSIKTFIGVSNAWTSNSFEGFAAGFRLKADPHDFVEDKGACSYDFMDASDPASITVHPRCCFWVDEMFCLENEEACDGEPPCGLEMCVLGERATEKSNTATAVRVQLENNCGVRVQMAGAKSATHLQTHDFSECLADSLIIDSGIHKEISGLQFNFKYSDPEYGYGDTDGWDEMEMFPMEDNNNYYEA